MSAADPKNLSQKEFNQRLRNELLGSRQDWITKCQNFIRTRSPLDFEPLSDDGIAAKALQDSSDQVVIGDDPLAATLESRHWVTARLIRTMAEALAASDQTQLADATAAVARWAESNQMLLGSADSQPKDSGDGPIFWGGHYADLMLAHLRGNSAKIQHTAASPVLLAGEGRSEDQGVSQAGNVGLLRLRLVSEGPPGLYPDPATMAFFRGDSDFVEALTTAWNGSGLSQLCVLWSLTDLTENPSPILNVNGPSLGATLGVLLDEMSGSRLQRSLRRRLIDPNAAITATLNPDGTLGAVGGYEKKFAAAHRNNLRVVIASDAPAQAREAATSASITLATVPSLTAAIREVRRRRNPRVVIAAIVLPVILALLASSSLWFRHQQVGALADSLANTARTLAISNPGLAAQYALTAHSLRSDAPTQLAAAEVANQNRFVIASTQAFTAPIRGTAANASLAYVTAVGSRELKVYRWPRLEEVGTETFEDDRFIPESCSDGTLYVVDGATLFLYTDNSTGSMPHQEARYTLPQAFNTKDPLISPHLFCNTNGDLAILSNSLQLSYFSLKNKQITNSDLSALPLFSKLSKPLTLGFASGFGSPDEAVAGPQKNFADAPANQFMFSLAGDTAVYNLHFGFELPADGLGLTPVQRRGPLWADWRGTIPSNTTTIGWLPNGTGVGGLQSYYGTPTGLALFPGNQLVTPSRAVGRVRSISTGYFGERSSSSYGAVMTETGFYVVTPDNAIISTSLGDLHNINALASYAVGEIRTDNGPFPAWIVGQGDGSVRVISSLPSQGSNDMNVHGVSTVGKDGSILQGDSQQLVSSISRIKPPFDNSPLQYNLPSRFFYVNSMDADGQYLVAGGITQDNDRRAFIAVWSQPGSPQKMIYVDSLASSYPPASGAAEDMASQVSLDVGDGIVTARDPLRKLVASWSLTTGDVVATYLADWNNQSGSISSNRDGSLVAIQTDSAMVLLKATTLAEVGSLAVPADSHAALSPDAKFVAHATEAGAVIRSLDGRVTVPVSGLSFTPDHVSWSPDQVYLVLTGLSTSDVALIQVATPNTITLLNIGMTTEIAAHAWVSGDRLIIELAKHNGGAGSYTVSRLLSVPISQDVTTQSLCTLARNPLSSTVWRQRSPWYISQPSWPCDSRKTSSSARDRMDSWVPCPTTAQWAIRGYDSTGVAAVAMCGDELTVSISGTNTIWNTVDRQPYGARAISPDSKLQIVVGDARSSTSFMTVNNNSQGSVRRQLTVTDRWIK